MIIPISSISVGARLREEHPEEDFNDLVESIKKFGLLQPILVKKVNGFGEPISIVDGKFEGYELVAGERRLRAVKSLGMTEIKAELSTNPTEEVSLMMEFEENIRRKDFTYQEKAKYVRKFHETFMKNSGGNWTQELTAISLKLSPASIHFYLEVEQAIADTPEVAKAGTMRGAIKRMKAVKEHAHRLALAAKDETGGQERARECLVNGDGVEWMKSLPNESCDLVNLDPPWGEDVSWKTDKAHFEKFDDSEKSASDLIPRLMSEAWRVLKPNRFCIIWYRVLAYNQIIEWANSLIIEGNSDKTLWQKFNLEHTAMPCIWYKPDKVSDKNYFPEKHLIHSYETFLLLRKGDPIFHPDSEVVQNVFVESRDSHSDLIHPTQKPVALMERIIKLLTVPGELVIDPTSGSGSTLVAGYKSLRKVKGCELSKAYWEKSFVRLVEVMK